MHALRPRRAALAATAIALVTTAVAVPAVLGSGTDSKSAAMARSGGWHLTGQSSAHTRAGLKAVYVTGSATVGPGQYHGGFLRCPRRFPHPIGGFFDSNSATLALTTNRPHPIGSTPRNVRSWAIGTTNFGNEPANVGVGITCIK